MGRKILFITSDQQRYDSLGCNGGPVAQTPVADKLAADGINYHRAYNQNTVCTPARSTMLTGQYVRTHGVVANGVALPGDYDSVARVLNEAGYRTALLGKAHFEPAFGNGGGAWDENLMGAQDRTGPYRGFERMELAMHVPLGPWHYSRWLQKHHKEYVQGFAPLLSAQAGGDTNAPETKYNPIPREYYHTDWVADRTIDWLDTLNDDEDWFVWMSFPDPHHPWDPPEKEARRYDWRDMPLPAGYPGSKEKCARILKEKPAHWLAWFEYRQPNLEGGPVRFNPQTLTEDNIREVNAMVHVENELIDEACGRVIDHIAHRGWDNDTDIFFTTDHGEMQGDYGLMYKGPYHVDALMRLPFIWRPAPSAGVPHADVSEPVGQLDLAPTFCDIAGVTIPAWMEGRPLPVAPGSDRERVLCEWDSQFDICGTHLRTIYRDGWICTVYEKSTPGVGFPAGGFLQMNRWASTLQYTQYDGTEGELYNVNDDPHQWNNLWDDPQHRGIKKDLIADLYDHLPKHSNARKVEAPA